MVKSLSVVIPAYNEEQNLPACFDSVHTVLKKLKLDWEIIVVNDGSKDKTGEVADSLKRKTKDLKVVHNSPNRGYGGSLKAGFAAASKDFIAFFPADNQFDFAQIHDLLNLQNRADADIVSGIRPYGGKDEPHRIFFRWGWNTLVRALFGYLASDVDCGFKLFRRSILEKVSLPSDGAMIDTELFAGARARGMVVEELEVRHLPRTAGKSTGGDPRVIFKALKELTVFWWQLKQEILVEKGLAVFKWEVLLLLLILTLGAFSRLYRIGEYATFLGDEGRDAIVMRGIVTGQHFPAIGPGTSIGSMYLGPLYYYLVAPSLALFNFSPVGPAVFVAVIGLLTTSLIWWIGRQWFGRSAALAVTLLYAVSPTVIIYSRSSWNPNVMPFFALLAMYGVWKVWRYGYWRWLVISSVSFAFVLNSHYLGLLLAPPATLFLIFSKNKAINIKYLILGFGVWALLMSPLLIFDLRHSGQNFAAVKTFFTDRQTTVNIKAYKAIPNLWPIWRDITSSLLVAKDRVWTAVFPTAFLLLLLFTTTRPGNKKDLIFVVVWLGFGLVGLGLYKQHIYDHYYGFLFPAVFLLLGFVIRTLKVFSAPLLLLLFTINLANSPLRYPPNNQLAHTHQVADFIKDRSSSRPFNLALLAKTNYDAGYRYFLDLNSAPYFTIHQRLSEQLFVICEIQDCQPIGNPLWEIAAFGWARVDGYWEFPWGVKLYRLVPNPTGKNAT